MNSVAHWSLTLAVAGVFAVSSSVTGCDKEEAGGGSEQSEESVQEGGDDTKSSEQAETAQPTSIDPPADSGALAYAVFEADKGFGLSWLEETGDGEQADADGKASYALRFARWSEEGWSEPQTVVEREEMFSNWADVPAVVETGDGSMMAHWLQKSGEPTYAYDVQVARSEDEGSNWTTLGTPYRDDSKTQHGFVSHVPVGDAVLSFWLDGRARDDGSGPMSLRAAELRPQAGADGEWFGESTVVDERVCECCPTDAVRVGESSVVAVYRGRTEEEVRDVHSVRRVEGEWADPRELGGEGWTIEGCPVNGPAVAADGTTVAASWFTEADGDPRVRAAISDDGGKDFSEPVTVADSSGASTPVGRVDVAFTGDRVAVSWLDEAAGDGEQTGAVKVRQMGGDGELGEPVRVAESSPERRSGIPRIASTEGGTAVVWRGPEEPGVLRAKWYPEGTLSGSSSDSDGGAGGAEEPGRPNVRARSVDGETVSLGEVEGPALVNLWATWCAPCRAEMPLLEKVQNEWSDRGLRMIGLSVESEDASDKIEEFVANNEMPFEVWYAPEQEPLSTFGAGAVPATYLYDSDGAVVWSHDGRIEEEELGELQEEVAAVVGE